MKWYCKGCVPGQNGGNKPPPGDSWQVCTKCVGWNRPEEKK